MTLYYNFEMMCSVPVSSWGGDEPKYRREMCDIDHEFSVDVSRKDVEEFFESKISEELFDFIDLDMLESDDDFIEFMTEKYEDKAYADAEDQYS